MVEALLLGLVAFIAQSEYALGTSLISRPIVTGLLTGRDIVAQTKDADVDEMLLCSVTLRAEGDLFLDDLSLDEFRRMLPFPVRMSANSGAALYQSLLGDIEKEST